MPSLGTIWGSRMANIVPTFVVVFFDFACGVQKWLDVPSLAFPGVVHIDGSFGAL
jgi:hypothetical protein